jgi:hypothetical protein
MDTEQEKQTMYSETVICQKCHSTRATNLKNPCGVCGAHKTIFGYLYEHEYRALFRASIVIGIFILIAIISSAIFLAFQWLLLANNLSDIKTLPLIVFNLTPCLRMGL